MSGKNFDSNNPVETRVAGAIHFSHAACAQRRLDFVRTEFRTSSEGHACAAIIVEQRRRCVQVAEFYTGVVIESLCILFRPLCSVPWFHCNRKLTKCSRCWNQKLCC